jgi:glycosyltransferase involved in cell wall biosynthesis
MVSDLIVVGERRPYAPSATYQLMSRLTLDRKVLWVDADAFGRARNPAPETPAVAVAEGRAPEDTKAPFPVLAAEDLGAGNHPLARLVSSRLLVRRVMRAAQQRRLRDPILWLASPWATALIEAGYKGRVVYQVGRQPPTLDAETARVLAAREAAIIARADVVLLPGRQALPQARRVRTRLLPTAVDLDLFCTPAQRARDLPGQGPIAGCHGHLDQGFDVQLLAGVARRLHAWRFMLLGPVSCDLGPLHGLANVSIAGARPHDQLPRYLQFWDASLLLRRPGAPAERAPAAPLLEALATGLPVVVAGACNLGGYADLVNRVDGVDGAVNALLAAAAGLGEGRALRRRRVAGDGWGARAAMVSRLLAEFDEDAAMVALTGAPMCR